MEDKYVRNSLRFFIGVLLLAVLYSCANIASPNGGPYDEAPPKFVSSTPLPNQINYKGKKVEIIFDELIQIDKPTENVIITPNGATRYPGERPEGGHRADGYVEGEYDLYDRLYQFDLR